jgi:hypothetical protein
MANFKEGDKIKVDEKEYDCVEASDGMATFVCDADFRNPVVLFLPENGETDIEYKRTHIAE